MDEIFSQHRLTLARQRRGLRKQELAARIGVTPKAVSRWECGERVPDDLNLRALSRELRFPVEYFFGDAPPSLEDWAFRSASRMTASQRDMALAAAVQAVALDQWLDTHIQRPPLDVPDLHGHTPNEGAVALRAAWGLGYKPLPNLVHLLESRGVRVYSLLHEGIEVDALSVWHGGLPFVFLNTSVTAERSRWDASHEIGHLVLHARTEGGKTRSDNREADEFAASFLMPAEPVIASAPRRLTLATVVQAKHQWGVSALGYVRRLHVLGRITEWQYKSLCIEIKAGYPRTEPGPKRPSEASRVLAWAFSSGKSGISRKHAVKHLRIPTSDLDDMTFGLALTPIAGGRATATPEPTGRADLRLVK